MTPRALCAILLLTGCAATKPAWVAIPDDPAEPHLRNVRQLTFGGENAEAYWSWDGEGLVLQVRGRHGFECDQIMSIDADGNGERLVSTGRGRTTCAFFLPGDDQVVYASTHQLGPECPTAAKADPGVYAWPIFGYDIFRADADGTDLVALTQSPGYDAEATVSPDGTIVFTSSRDGDLDIYTMRSDGSDVKRLTHAAGYDGGPFFSGDGKKIVYRAYHPTDAAEVAKFKDLLARGLVQPTKMDLWIMDADGSNQRQITNLGKASFCPYLRMDGERILFASNWQDPKGREFEIYRVNTDGSELERVTHTAGFDGFPMFSPDGKQIVWCSNRHSAKTGDTNVFLADWVE